MAASLVIEEEFGTTNGWSHAHNGYWAGDFSTTWNVQPPSSLHDARRTTSAITSASTVAAVGSWGQVSTSPVAQSLHSATIR